MSEGQCHCGGFPYPDLSRLAEFDGYMRQRAAETGDYAALEFWHEIRRSINRPITEHIKRTTGRTTP